MVVSLHSTVLSNSLFFFFLLFTLSCCLHYHLLRCILCLLWACLPAFICTLQRHSFCIIMAILKAEKRKKPLSMTLT
uniref:Uncharacterized protein n=1 Tax=Amblyomma triste TaxID=251400 RepID=A0A023G3A9_AMBTT